MQIYINFSNNDREIARSLSQTLEGAGHYVVWRHELDPRTKAGAEDVLKNIAQSELMLVIVTDNLNNSDYALGKVAYAKFLDVDIVPVVAKGSPLPYNILGYDYLNLELAITEPKWFINHLPVVQTAQKRDKSELINTQMIDPLRQKRSDTIRVFVAYSRKQRTAIRELTELLERNGIVVFWDEKIQPGVRWRQTIQKALDGSTHVIVVWTPDAANSDEVEREVSYALAERKIVVPILSKEIPKLPYHLHGLHYIVLQDNLADLEEDLLKALRQYEDDDAIWE